MSNVTVRTELAKVVHLVDSHYSPATVVINWGSRDGVKVGDKFLIFGYGPDIVDPDNGEDLGRVELVRGRGEVVHVQDNLATVRSVERRRTRPSKRIYRDGVGFGIVRSGTVVEEEIPAEEDMPFEGVAVGDIARPI